MKNYTITKVHEELLDEGYDADSVYINKAGHYYIEPSDDVLSEHNKTLIFAALLGMCIGASAMFFVTYLS